MSAPAEDLLERRLARALNAGTWIGSGVVAVGLVASFWSTSGAMIERAGVAIFILLPVARVALMMATFMRRRERLFALLAALVLVITIGGTVASVFTHAAA